MDDALLLPLDDRPCNVLFPKQLAEIGGFKLKTPPRVWLGNAQKSAKLSALQAWIESCLSQTKELFLSLDTWLYGGLISSRRTLLEPEMIEARLACFQAWKNQYPQLEIHLFATLMRISDSYDATEEKPYWAQYGREVYRLSQLEHQVLEYPELQAALAEQYLKIPPEIVTDYRKQRQQNLGILQRVLDLQQSGCINTLLIGCDDGAEFGWNVQEKQTLNQRIQKEKLTGVLLYPGADELACTLLARVLVPGSPAIQVSYSHPEAVQLATRYEGIPLRQTVAAQAEAVGLQCLSETEKTPPQFSLWIHNPPGEQVDQFLERESRLIDDSALAALARHVQTSPIPVALADVYYANGGDYAVLQALESQGLLWRLAAYGGWNTAGNTLGLILAWLKFLGHHQDRLKQQRFFLERLLDDGYYQGFLRQKQCEHYSEPVTMAHCLECLAFFNDKLQQWKPHLSEQLETLEVETLTYPWQRFFEIELALSLNS